MLSGEDFCLQNARLGSFMYSKILTEPHKCETFSLQSYSVNTALLELV
jgi:hypothetical protein